MKFVNININININVNVKWEHLQTKPTLLSPGPPTRQYVVPQSSNKPTVYPHCGIYDSVNLSAEWFSVTLIDPIIDYGENFHQKPLNPGWSVTMYLLCGGSEESQKQSFRPNSDDFHSKRLISFPLCTMYHVWDMGVRSLKQENPNGEFSKWRRWQERFQGRPLSDGPSPVRHVTAHLFVVFQLWLDTWCQQPFKSWNHPQQQ